MKTRDKILRVALKRFNEKGIQDVSQRDIAGELKISVGNLNYHFPTTNDIIYALSLQLIDAINKEIQNIIKSRTPNSLIAFHRMMYSTFTIQLKFKFMFNKRYAEIVTTIPEIQDYTQKTFANHFAHGIQIFQHLVSEGFLEKHILPDLNGFIFSQNMLATYWQQELAIFQPQLSDEEKVEQAISVAFLPYKPYLTEKGKTTLMPLLKKLKHYKKS